MQGEGPQCSAPGVRPGELAPAHRQPKSRDIGPVVTLRNIEMSFVEQSQRAPELGWSCCPGRKPKDGDSSLAFGSTLETPGP